MCFNKEKELVMRNYGIIESDIIPVLQNAKIDSNQYFIYTVNGETSEIDHVRSETWYTGDIIKGNGFYKYTYSVQVFSYANGTTDLSTSLLVECEGTVEHVADYNPERVKKADTIK